MNNTATAVSEPYQFPEPGYMPMPAAFVYRSVFLHGRPRHRKYDAFWIKHPPMDPGRRAKIFAPFDALRGFTDLIREKDARSLENTVPPEESRDVEEFFPISC